MDKNKYTSRSMSIFELCKSVTKENGIDYINSIVFFISALKVNESTLKELNELYGCRIQNLIEILNQEKSMMTQYINEIDFQVSDEFNEILMSSKQIAETYKQTMINEGNIIEAILNCESEIVQKLKNVIDIQQVRNIACCARDLLVNLKTVKYESCFDSRTVSANKVNHNELLSLIESHFGSKWTESVKHSLEKDEDSVFVAIERDLIIGFSTYDSSECRKGVFGPMGVFGNRKREGIGKLLLLRALNRMKIEGYQYAVIGQAGPIEFYEKNCNAILIPVGI